MFRYAGNPSCLKRLLSAAGKDIGTSGAIATVTSTRESNVTEKNIQEKQEKGKTATSKSEEEEIADVSPGRLQKSSESLERAKVCHAEGVIDEISYTAIAKIRRGIIERERREELQHAPPPEQSKPRILCMVYTHEGAHATNLQAIVDTWASQCDGFFAGSNVTDPSLGAVDIKFPGPESYGNMWNKVQAMWKYAYKHYLNDYDYFHICGDDTYVIPDNFRTYLMGDQVKNLLNGHLDEFSTWRANEKATRWKTQRPRPLLLGFPIRFWKAKHIIQFAAGGSGCKLKVCVLPKASFSLFSFVEKDSTEPHAPYHQLTNAHKSLSIC